jgi:hypothetical protein
MRERGLRFRFWCRESELGIKDPITPPIRDWAYWIGSVRARDPTVIWCYEKLIHRKNSYLYYYIKHLRIKVSFFVMIIFYYTYFIPQLDG